MDLGIIAARDDMGKAVDRYGWAICGSAKRTLIQPGGGTKHLYTFQAHWFYTTWNGCVDGVLVSCSKNKRSCSRYELWCFEPKAGKRLFENLFFSLATCSG